MTWQAYVAILGVILFVASGMVAERHSGYYPGTGYKEEARGWTITKWLMIGGFICIAIGMEGLFHQ